MLSEDTVRAVCWTLDGCESSLYLVQKASDVDEAPPEYAAEPLVWNIPVSSVRNSRVTSKYSRWLLPAKA